MIALEAGRQFVNQHAEHRVALIPHPDADGLAGAVILWNMLQGTREVFSPEKGQSIYAEAFRDRLRGFHPDALIVIDQGSFSASVLSDVSTMTVDHHVPRGIPSGVFVTSYPHHPSESASHLCYLLADEPENDLGLAALGEISNYGAHAPFGIVEAANKRYTPTALLETVALINAARRSSQFDWRTAFDILLGAQDPRQISQHDIPGVAQLIVDREEVTRELHRARKGRPFFADPWAIIPFSSPCLIHDLVAGNWLNRLKEHYVVAANFGYRPGYIHFSVRSVLPVDLTALLRDLAPEAIPSEWGHTLLGSTGGSISKSDFILLLTAMGFTPEQVLGIERAVHHLH